MVRIHLQRPSLAGDSLFAIIGRCAVATAPRYLGAVLALSVASTTLLRSLSPSLAALFVMTAAIALWGLMEQLLPPPRRAVVDLAQWLLVGIGGVAAILSALGILFWILGPAPVL
jgi:hypothetical protein